MSGALKITEKMAKSIIYQMLPRLWGNIKGRNIRSGSLAQNGCGKFSSIDHETLDYLKNGLGCTHVWYTGVIRHASEDSSHPQILKGRAGSPYAIKDYFDVNPYLADNEAKRMDEFESLVKRTHKAGLKVILDFIPNHVARDYGRTCRRSMAPYVLGTGDDKTQHWSPDNDFFYYPGQPLRLPNAADFAGNEFEENPAKATGNVFSPSPSANDWYETVKINYCDFHTSTWDKMAEVIRYWADKGVDGFRCDMVELVPPQFFEWLIAKMKIEFPHLIFIAEVYQKELYSKYIDQVGFDLLYDKSGLYDRLRSCVQWGAPASVCTNNWQELGALQPHMLNFLENHDEQRFASGFFGLDASQVFAPLDVSLFQNTASFMIYAGQEAGEKAADSEGFSGADGRTSIFDWWSVPALKWLWLRIHGEKIPSSLSAKLKSSVSAEKLWKRYCEELRFATESAAVREGQTYDLCWCNLNSKGFNPDKHYVWLRHSGNETILFAANFDSSEAVMDINVPDSACEFLGIPAGGGFFRLRVHPHDAIRMSIY